MTVNTNGVVSHDFKVGCGGIIGDTICIWIGGYTKMFGICNVFNVELWGVLEGLKRVHKKKLDRVEVQLDLNEAIRS